MKNPETPLNLDEFLELLELFVGVLIFIILLGVDTVRAGRKGAHWIPQHALVLSALTIQIMGWLNAESTLLTEIMDDKKHLLNGDVLKNNLYLVHVSRLMLCVLVAYMLPGMARPGDENSWSTLAALGLSIFVHILSDLFSIYRRMRQSGGFRFIHDHYFWPHFKEVSQYSFVVSNGIISIALVWLLLLLGCATIANKSIRDIVAQKIPTILAHQCDATASMEAVENQVLKSWIVSRACYPESIIARSVLTVSAAVAVTVCNLISILGWLLQGPVVYVFPWAKSRFKFVTAILQVIFIIVVWAMMGWRCLTCVAFFGRWQSWHRNENWTWPKYLRVEDFWTRYILQLQEAESNKEKSKMDERVNAMIGTEGIKIWFLGSFLRSVFWLQFSVVYFSKGCWLIAELVLDNRLMHRLFSKLLPRQDETVEEDFLKHKALLENVDLLWEAPRTVFVSNQRSIKQTKELMEQGKMDGHENCNTLITFLRKYRKSTECEDPAKLVKNQTGLKFLGKIDPVPLLDVEKYFIYARKQSWKLKAVSLINIIVRLSPICGENALKAYSDACQLMGLVDDSEPETDSLLSKAADSLLKIIIEEQTAENVQADAENIEDAAARIKKLAEESEMKAMVIKGGRDSLDWEKAGAGNAVYKLCKSIDCSSAGDCNELVNELQSVLADIIGSCIKKVGAALLNDSIKWAQDFQERKLLKAVYFAGKNTALMEELEYCV